MKSRRTTALLGLTILGAVACSEDPDSNAADDAAFGDMAFGDMGANTANGDQVAGGSNGTASGMTSGTGSLGEMPGDGSNGASTGSTPATDDGAATGGPAMTNDGVADDGASGVGGGSDDAFMDDGATDDAPVDNAPADDGSMASADDGASDDAAASADDGATDDASADDSASVGADDAAGADDGAGVDDDSAGDPDPTPEVTFQKAVGTIPNQPQPPSTVNLSQDSWRDGIISPSLLAGHQINQPAVVNGYLVIGGNEEFWIYDASDPTAPQELSSMVTPDRRPGGEAESHTISFARYGDTFYMVTIGGTGIDTWDITDPNAPQHVGKVAIAGANYGDYTEAIWGVTWQGQYIYVGATNNGIRVVDASDPAALRVVKEVPTSQYGGVSAGAIDAIGNVLVLTTPKESGGVATLDISDPENPTRLASFSTGISYIGQFYRRWVFLIGAIRAWDVLTDPRNIGIGSSPIGTLNNDNAEYMTFSDDYMFLGHARAEIGGTPGSSKIDVSDPTNMRVESRVWGRMDLGGINDDQFNMPIGNLLVVGDDQSPYPGWVLAVHQTDPDTTPPVIDTVIPKDGTSDNSTKSRIGVTFSDNIDLATVNAASFIVRPVGGEPLPGKYGVRMGVLNFDPDVDLEPGTTYEVVLPQGGVADLVGNTLATEWTSTFTTN